MEWFFNNVVPMMLTVGVTVLVVLVMVFLVKICRYMSLRLGEKLRDDREHKAKLH